MAVRSVLARANEVIEYVRLSVPKTLSVLIRDGIA
jgi:hypothetical protein